MDRDDGACADKINAHNVMKTIAFLKARKTHAEEAIDIKRIHRHMNHAIKKGHLLTSFSQQLLRYQLPSLPKPKETTKVQKKLMGSMSAPQLQAPRQTKLELELYS